MITRRQFATTLAGMATSAVLARPGNVWADQPPLRIAISLEMLAGANVNDARAAYRVWADQISQSLALRHAQVLDRVYFPSAELLQMIRSGQVDFIALTALEYARVIDQIDPEWMLVQDDFSNGLEYLLLVRNNSPYRGLEDLKGAKLLTYRHPTDCLLRQWLTVRLASVTHQTVEEFFDAPEFKDKISEVVLPLFFGSIQAAALSRSAFEMAIELNPQLGRELRIVDVSPKVIPNGFWTRRNCNAEDKHVFEQAMLRVKTMPSGRQVLALFQTSGYSSRPCSIMTPTVDFIRSYESIRRRGGEKP